MIFLARFKKSYASRYSNCGGLKKNWTEKKKIRIPDEICFLPPPLPPIISKASPSLKDTIMKDHRKGTHFPDIVTGLTMGSTTFEEVGVWWFRSGQEFFQPYVTEFFLVVTVNIRLSTAIAFFSPRASSQETFLITLPSSASSCFPHESQMPVGPTFLAT